MAPTNVVINQQPFPVTFSPLKPIVNVKSPFKKHGQRVIPERSPTFESKHSIGETEMICSKLTNVKVMMDQRVGSEADFQCLKEDDESPLSGRGTDLEWRKINISS